MYGRPGIVQTCVPREQAIAAVIFVVLTTVQSSAALFHQVAHLHPAVPPSYERYGYAVAIENSTVFVGGPEDGSGSVYIYENDGSGHWPEVAHVYPASEAVYNFGTSLSIQGSTLLVGAPRTNAAMGAAYVLRNSGEATWSQIAELIPSDPQTWRRFGETVSLDGQLALVGAPGGADLPVPGAKTGAAYLFQNDGNDHWTQIAKFVDSIARPTDYFAYSTLLSNGIVFIDNLGEQVAPLQFGAIDVFAPDEAGNWSKRQSITASFPGGRVVGIGDAMAADESTFLVTGTAEINGADQTAVFVFHHDAAGIWHQTAEILAPDLNATSGWSFGKSIAIKGSIAVIGDSKVGAAYIFRENSDFTWQLIDTLLQNDPNPNFSANFGRAVALDDQFVVVGAPSDGPSNGAYIFQIPEPSSMLLAAFGIIWFSNRQRRY